MIKNLKIFNLPWNKNKKYMMYSPLALLAKMPTTNIVKLGELANGNSVFKELNINNENFKLKVFYDSKKREWDIKDEKNLSIEMYIDQLPQGVDVFLKQIDLSVTVRSNLFPFDKLYTGDYNLFKEEKRLLQRYGSFAVKTSINDFNSNFQKRLIKAYNEFNYNIFYRNSLSENECLHCGIYGYEFLIKYQLCIERKEDKPCYTTVTDHFIVGLENDKNYPYYYIDDNDERHAIKRLNNVLSTSKLY